MKTIGFVIFDRFQSLDLSGPLAAFEIAARNKAEPRYGLRILSRGGGPVASSAGMQVLSEPLSAAGELDTLLVVGGQGSDAAAACPELIEWVRGCGARRIGSVCTGAFVLAAAGLLDGLRATTHWSRCQDFARAFPKVRVEADLIHVREGQVWTSAGVTAGIDLALAMIADDFGEALARSVAQGMVVYYRRPGGQSQFSALLDLAARDEPFRRLMGWMRDHLDARLDVEALAAQVHMSPRHFSRRFTAETGMSPARAVERLRLEAARGRIEGERTPVEVIARETGFHDPERMRRAFLRAFGQPPQALRRRA